MVDDAVFNASFNGAASSQSNYHKRKQQVSSITQLLNSTDGLKQYTMNKTANNRGEDQLSTSVNLQTNNLFMPNNNTKGTSAAAGKNNAILASDLGISIKSMYKQLQNSGAPTENKNYLNSHVQPAAQLQATKVMNSGTNLN